MLPINQLFALLTNYQLFASINQLFASLTNYLAHP